MAAPDPAACPYLQRFRLQAPPPYTTRERLRDPLAPQHGDRVLEIGHGTGFCSLDVAQWIAPEGTLEVLDVQQEMLVLRGAREGAISTITATRGDARRLPYPDATFDAAFPVSARARSPTRTPCGTRIPRPGGRLVVGDPHWVSPTALRRLGRPHPRSSPTLRHR